MCTTIHASLIWILILGPTMICQHVYVCLSLFEEESSENHSDLCISTQPNTDKGLHKYKPKTENKPDMVAHTFKPSTLGGWGKRVTSLSLWQLWLSNTLKMMGNRPLSRPWFSAGITKWKKKKSEKKRNSKGLKINRWVNGGFMIFQITKTGRGKEQLLALTLQILQSLNLL